MAKLKPTHTNGKTTATPAVPFSPPQPTFPTATLYFEGLPSVALIIPDPTSLEELARIQGVIAQQLTLKAIAITAEHLKPQSQPERILGPDEAAPVA